MNGRSVLISNSFYLFEDTAYRRNKKADRIGIAVLVIVYSRIYNKYKSASAGNKRDGSTPKTPKAVIAAMAFISIAVVIVAAASFSYGDKDPDVSIWNDRIEIKAMMAAMQRIMRPDLSGNP